MEVILLLVSVPLTACFIAFVARYAVFMRRTIALLYWLELVGALYLFQPILNGKVETIQLLTDFSANRLSVLFLSLTIFVCASSLSHADAFFKREREISTDYDESGERVFYASASLFVLAMSVMFVCDNLGILWISMEATTLSSAALVYFSRTKQALEATWKYVIICSVGIAFALLGTVLIFGSSQHGAVAEGSLNINVLMKHAALLQYPLLRLGFIFCLVGYGTKAGVFPIHSWLPDAHSEAPAPASAMLSGALLNAALYIIWRLSQLMIEAHHETLAQTLTLTMGTLTVASASLFLVKQYALKRMLAYSSIENVGIMLIAIGLGSGPLFFLQACNHSISKVALFLISGNVIQAAGSKKLRDLRGILHSAPVWGLLLAVAALAVTGSPPFGTFICELLILVKSIEQGRWLIFAVLIFALALSFVAVCLHVSRVIFGAPKERTEARYLIQSSLIPAMLCLLAIACGITSLPLLLVSLQ